jgi:hypothetical protein
MTSRFQLATIAQKFFRLYICAHTFAFSVCLVDVANAQDSQQAAPKTQPTSNLPHQWVRPASRESKDGPTLVVTDENGEAKSHAAVADTTLISYLADRAWGKLPWLAIILNDTNRVLLRFDPVTDVAVRRAELVLSPNDKPQPFFVPCDSPVMPSQPFEVSIYEVQEPWDENKVTWTSQPKIAGRPAAKASLDPKASEFRIDVTELVKREGGKDASQ